MTKVFVRGRGISCSLGTDIDNIISSIRNNRIAATQMSMDIGDIAFSRPYFRIPTPESVADCRSEEYFYQVLFDTVQRALDNAGLTSEETEDLTLFFGSTAIDIPIYESKYEQHPDSREKFFSNDSPGFGYIVSKVAERFNIRGGCYTFTTACTSTANAMLYANAMIKEKMIKRALVIGYDLYNDLGFLGFESLMLIVRGPYRPFDKNRTGIIMGESCGAVVLDTQRNDSKDFYIMGGANICDTNNVTTHNVDGSIIGRVIQGAIDNAGMDKSDIDLIKAHATGTMYNDRTEVMGMRLVYGDSLPPVTGIKPYIGHTVGAAGATELVVMTEAAKRGFVPASPGFETVDEELGLAPITEHMPFDRGNIMLNYFGFGGNCTSMIISNRE